ncbi:MAG: trehalose-phosphatase [Myxococcales bacterium]|nr:trehalose-phosphatase [Myxococcales bacterium]
MSRVESLLHSLLDLERPLLLAFDVDGTLAPIVRDPDLARIPERTLSVLQALARAPTLVLALITGRDLDSLGRMEQLDGVWRAVEHGGVVLAPGQSPAPRALTSEQHQALDRFRRWVETHASDTFVEHKPQAIAVHVRGVAENDPTRADWLLREADELADRLGLHVRRGKALREAEAVAHDKGNALREIFERSGARSVFFAGDDLTDSPAIDFATKHGIGVFVRSDEQRDIGVASAHLLENVDEVTTLLAQLSKHVSA